MIDHAIVKNDGGTGDMEMRGNLPVSSDLLHKYLTEISKYPILTKEEELDVSRRAFENNDRDAAQRLAVSNLRLVVKIALEYYSTYCNILDLIQEGNVGLLRAVKKFDPHKGAKFSTYASFWIRAFMLKHMMDSYSLVKVGTTQDQRKLFYRLNKEKQRLEALGLSPTPKLLASKLNVKEKDVENMQKRLSFPDLSLETPISENSDDTLMDVMKSDLNVDDIVSDRERAEKVAEKVMELRSAINHKEAYVLDNRIMAEVPSTLEEIGMTLNVSRERVRQIENRVMLKIKTQFQGESASLYF